MSVLIIAFAVLVILIVIGLSDINIHYRFSHIENENSSKIILKIWFIKFKIPVKKDNKELKDLKKQKKKRTDASFKYYYKLLKYLKNDLKKTILFLKDRMVKIQDLDINIKFGFSDAAATGIAVGVVNGAVYGTLGFLHHNFNLKKFNVEIEPYFEREIFEACVEGSIRIKTIHILSILFLVFKLFKKKFIGEKKGMI